MKSALIDSVSIRRGDDSDAEFFFEMEEQTTWENLPRLPGAQWQREVVREALCATHHVLLQMPGNVFFVAEIEGVRAGLLWFGLKRNAISGEEEGWIYNLTVCEEFRGRGLAKMLMMRAEDYASDEGLSVLGLSVAVHNEIAQGLYARLGYEPSNILMRKALEHNPKTATTQCVVCQEGDE